MRKNNMANKIKKIISVTLAALVLLSAVAFMTSCDGGKNNEGRVYYLNFKPEQDGDWQKLAKLYTEKTGIPVTVLTASDNQYENTLATEMDKSEAPTLFQVNGVQGLQKWKNDCYDLSGSELYKQLTSEEFALKDGSKVLGIAYVIETYGIIYNRTLLDKYFSSDWSTVKKLDDINSFTSLKTVVEEIQAHKSDIGVDGAFTSSGMDSSSDWRFKSHLANVPIYYEYKSDKIDKTEAIKGTYLDNFKNIWDLYINNATVDKSVIATKTGNDASAEFSSGRAVFYQNGTWAVGDVTGEGKLEVSELGILPIYIGVEGEEEQALCTGSENYWCVNKNASEADINATLDFLEWVVTSEEGTTAIANDMGFVSPFKKAKESSNPLSKIANDYIAAGKTPIAWVFTTMPSEDWKNGVGAAMVAYAQGKGDWSAVENAFVNGWKTEYDKANG
jgi:raffinose/stachyose/melibiose transport system substrate-binding protein